MASQGGAARGTARLDAGDKLLLSLSVPKNSVHPNMAKLFIGLMVTREGQAVLEKNDMRSSYLVDGTLMSKYVKANKLKLQDPRELNEVFQKEDTSLEEELTKILLK